MDPSQATVVLNYLQTAVTTASDSLQDWSKWVFGCVFILSIILSFTKHSIKRQPFDANFLGQEAMRGFTTAMVVGGYFILSMPWMEKMREAGMALSGSDAETVDIGEIARQADTVTQEIERTVEALNSGGLFAPLQNFAEIASLSLLSIGVSILYLIIAMISFWVYAKFLLGYVVGGVFVGGLGWGQTFQYGKASIGYILFSAIPLFLLAFLQGISSQILDGATLVGGEPATIPVIWDLIFTQGFLMALSLVAARVPGEVLSSVVGAGDAPRLSNVPQTMGQGGSALTSTVTNSMSMLGGGGGVGGSLPGGGSSNGSNGGAPPTVGEAPALVFTIT